MLRRSPELDKLQRVIKELSHAANVLGGSFPGETAAARRARDSVAELIRENVLLLGEVSAALSAGEAGEPANTSPSANTSPRDCSIAGGPTGDSMAGGPAGDRKAVRDGSPEPVEIRQAYGHRVEIYSPPSLRRTSSSVGRFVGETIHLELALGLSPAEREQHIERLVRRLVAARRLPRLREWMLRLAKERFPECQLRVGQIRFHEQKRRWGSCSSRGNINLSYRLLDCPDELLEYVCIHELVHLIEFNHSPRFWALVERADPDYRIHREQLRELEQSHGPSARPGTGRQG